MRRLIAVTLVAPAILAAAEDVKGQPSLLDKALTRGVTNDRPYRPASRLDARYQEVRGVIARSEALLMTGAAASIPLAEVSSSRASIEQAAAEIGLLTEHERAQYEQTIRDLDAIDSALAANGIGRPVPVTAAPATPPVDAPAMPEAAPTEPAAAAPVGTPASDPAAPVEGPLETPAAAPPAEATDALPPIEAPAAAPVELPAETTDALPPAETPAAPVEMPVELTDVLAPVEMPAELTDVLAPVEMPAESTDVLAPVETPAVSPVDTPEDPAPVETPAVEVPAEPAAAPEAEAVPAPAGELPPE